MNIKMQYVYKYIIISSYIHLIMFIYNIHSYICIYTYIYLHTVDINPLLKQNFFPISPTGTPPNSNPLIRPAPTFTFDNSIAATCVTGWLVVANLGEKTKKKTTTTPKTNQRWMFPTRNSAKQNSPVLRLVVVKSPWFTSFFLLKKWYIQTVVGFTGDFWLPSTGSHLKGVLTKYPLHLWDVEKKKDPVRQLVSLDIIPAENHWPTKTLPTGMYNSAKHWTHKYIQLRLHRIQLPNIHQICRILPRTSACKIWPIST